MDVSQNRRPILCESLETHKVSYFHHQCQTNISKRRDLPFYRCSGERIRNSFCQSVGGTVDLVEFHTSLNVKPPNQPVDPNLHFLRVNENDPAQLDDGSGGLLGGASGPMTYIEVDSWPNCDRFLPLSRG